ncbi:MAG: autotransporter domain-containing protein [Parvibaculum sp.]|nr:autotransporter domain-containing protein [Parvibaculum sp.]
MSSKNVCTRPRRHLRGAAVALTSLPMLWPVAPAAAVDWDLPGPGDWFVGGNWDPAGVPGPGDTVDIDNGGTATIAAPGATSNDANIGLTLGNSGAVIVGGAGSWTNSSIILVGNAGTGALTIDTGGTVNSFSTRLGQTATGIGTLTLDGAGTTLDSTGDLLAGVAGQGTIDILNGATASGGIFWIGLGASSTGIVNIDGAGSNWTGVTLTYVGEDGDGTLTITDGGAASNSGGFIAFGAGSTGAATVDGANSLWTNNGDLHVGRSGTGTLDVTAGGTVTSTNGRIGTFAAGTGTAVIDGAGSAWTIAGDLTVGQAGSGVLTLANGAAVTVNGGAGTVNIASNGGSAGTLNIGAASGGAAVAAGTLDAASLVFGTGTGELVFNHTGLGLVFGAGISGAGAVTVENGVTVLTAAADHTGGTTISGGTLQAGNGGTTGALSGNLLNSGIFTIDRSNVYTWSGVMTGAGDFNHLGAGTTTLTGNSIAFAGATAVDAGTLIVNGQLGGMLSVGAARLGGTGTVGQTALGNGATIAPGNSIGALNVAGDIDFAAGATYEVEVDDGGNTAGVNNDWIHATGAATIDGAAMVTVLPENGTDDGSTYVPGTIYTILTADGGVTGTFGGVTDSFAFLNSLLSYDANNVYLTLISSAAFQDAARTPNQFNTAGAAESLGAGNPIHDAILPMTEADARAAFDALSGEIHATGRLNAFHVMRQIREAVLARLRAVLPGPADGAPPASGIAPVGAGLWAHVFGAWGSADGNGNHAAVDRDWAGFVGGVDREFGAASRAGLALGYSRSGFDVDARASSGDSENFHIAGYAGTKRGNLALNGVVAWSHGSVDTERTATVGGLTNRLTAGYNAQLFEAAIDAGFDVATDFALLTPFAGFAVVHAETDGFTERGGPAALTVAGASDTVGIATLGLRARRAMPGGSLHGALAWRHAFGDTDPAIDAAFATAPATRFTVHGVPLAKNALALDLGLDRELAPGTSVSFGYAGEYASGARDHGLKAELRIAF